MLDTRAQLDAISMALAELQAKEQAKKERKPIGFNKNTKNVEHGELSAIWGDAEDS